MIKENPNQGKMKLKRKLIEKGMGPKKGVAITIEK
eukprot:CAMPEP_0116895980 /NCGR_PEP_ID=MMETSP0467-20121206/5349_1 /TAXON_ID=283647 /ORGANISM="Mesodinium pulex, Strain SPMC105" /LENGTH=34 /DNA_ID= /DNA_START= /DNA_END= /DNA_ORIENTATION=